MLCRRTVPVSLSIAELIAAASLATWIYLLLGRGGFWRVGEEAPPAASVPLKSVAVVIPARNEEAGLRVSVASPFTPAYGRATHRVVGDCYKTECTPSRS